MPVIKLDELDIACLGPPVEHLRGRFPLLLLHGACCNSLIWRHQVDCLNRDGIATVAIDLPGHRESGGNSTGFVESYAHFIAKLADEMEWKSFFLAGHSMGGTIALTFALLYPGKLAGLGLLATGAKLKVAPIIFQLLEESPDKAIDFFIQGLSGDKLSASDSAFLREVMGPTPPKTALDDFTACENFNIMSRIAEIDVSARALVGTADFAAPAKYSQYLADTMPDCKAEFVDGAGHMLMIEQPDTVCDWLRQVVNPAF